MLSLLPQRGGFLRKNINTTMKLHVILEEIYNCVTLHMTFVMYSEIISQAKTEEKMSGKETKSIDYVDFTSPGMVLSSVATVY